MFEFLFKFPWQAFQKGSVVLARNWPLWLLILLLALAAAAVGALLLRRRGSIAAPGRLAALGALQWGLLALLLLLLWQPALSVSTLEAHQNAIAVLVDTSISMNIDDENSTRLQSAKKVLDSGLLDSLRKRFTVVLYEAGPGIKRVDTLNELQPVQRSTRLGEVLKQVAAESSTLPLGGVILLSDGADNSGGVDRESIQALRASRLPVYTVGFGKEELRNDVEIAEVQVPARALPGARVSASVSFRQQGFAGRPARLEVRDGGKVLAARVVKLPADGQVAREAIALPVGADPGARTLSVILNPQEGEISAANNKVTRVLHVDRRKPRILYFEGEPRWELKFMRRAAELDRNLELVSMLRTTQNKIYRQGIQNPNELLHGFPTAVEELFGYDALIFGAVEAGSLNATQLSLVKEFADRRGGGVLFLGGRNALSDGGWQKTPVAEMLPVQLPDRKGTFHRDEVKVALTPQAGEHPITRLAEDTQSNAGIWSSMPPVADYQEVGAPKPAALVLLEAFTPRGRFPLLVTQPYGRGRVAVLATGGTWRWQMLKDSKDQSHEAFWQQVLRWLVSDTPGRVRGDLVAGIVYDQGQVELRAEARDRNYLPAVDAVIEARILGPNNLIDRVELQPDSTSPGWAKGRWGAPSEGAFLAEIVARRGDEELGRAVTTFLREDGTAEAFRAQQDRPLLEQIAEQTGGLYSRPSEAMRIADRITFSEAGISKRDLKDLWDAPFFFLLMALLKAAEWLLRRRWGAV